GVVDLDRERRFGWGAAGVTDQGDVEIVASKRRYVLVIRDGGTSKIVLSASRDVKKAITTIGKGEWSGWIDERFGGKRALRQYKLVDLSADGSKVTIYGSMAATPTGWGFPKGIEKKIIEHAGGYVEALELSPDAAFRAGWFGRDKMGQIMDIMELQADWTVKCAQYLADTEEWDAMFVQFHAPDGINHDILGDMESEDPSIRRRADEWLGETYRVLFKMVDEIRNACADKNTHVCVVSDHGNIPIRKWINLPGILMRQNWLEFAEDTGSKRWSVDPTKTVCWHAEHQSGVWINVAGREKSGLVKRGAEYESLRWRIIDHLRRVVDEETGEPVFAVVARREDLQSLGVWGNRFADILCIANPQYLTYVERVGDLPKQDVDAYLAAPDVVDIADAPLSASLRALTAVHWHLPTASVGYASNCGCFIMTGPGVAQGMSGEWVNLVDVAPTLAHCLGIEPPAHAEGRIVREAFD
ncbi:MAG: alkaline phosphatase family protein, partial [Candidatus Latescibacteria bacterium]|nr:alkaline phosphatase family protein [Candidatus Latescibacterota bacterium]